MNRKEIKAEAKAKVKGNKWNILWPLLVMGVVYGIIGAIFGVSSSFDFSSLNEAASISPVAGIGTLIGILLTCFFSAGYIKYLITFARTGKFDSNEIIKTVKEKWLNILIASILVYVIVSLCTILFVIPGIIMKLAYSFAMYLVVDTEVSGSDALRESRQMMKGYKWNYFVFLLSFIGWFILGLFTFGISYIWLIPYMFISSILYYDKLKANTKKAE